MFEYIFSTPRAAQLKYNAHWCTVRHICQESWLYYNFHFFTIVTPKFGHWSWDWRMRFPCWVMFGLSLTSYCISGHCRGLFQYTWWRHQMETFSALLAICAGNSPVIGEFPAQRPVTRGFDVFFHLRLNKRLSLRLVIWDAIVIIMTSFQCSETTHVYFLDSLYEIRISTASYTSQWEMIAQSISCMIYTAWISHPVQVVFLENNTINSDWYDTNFRSGQFENVLDTL